MTLEKRINERELDAYMYSLESIIDACKNFVVGFVDGYYGNMPQQAPKQNKNVDNKK